MLGEREASLRWQAGMSGCECFMCTCVTGAGGKNYQLSGEPENRGPNHFALEGVRTKSGNGKGNRIFSSSSLGTSRAESGDTP